MNQRKTDTAAPPGHIASNHLPWLARRLSPLAKHNVKSTQMVGSLAQPVEPLISVIIPTYNRRELLPGAIASVLRQTFINWELIIVDDGSRDGTEAVVDPFRADSRVRYVSQTQQGR